MVIMWSSELSQLCEDLGDSSWMLLCHPVFLTILRSSLLSLQSYPQGAAHDVSTAGLKEPPHLPSPPQRKVRDINVIFELISSRLRRLSPSSCLPVQPNTDILTVGLIFCAG